MRIVSFLTAGTEIACALGLGESLVGRGEECDYPPAIRDRPVVVRPAVRTAGQDQQDIDRMIREQVASGGALYEVDELLLRALAPDLVIAQDLCQVCAPAGRDTAAAIRDLPRQPEVVLLNATTLDGVKDDIRRVAAAAGVPERGRALADGMTDRIRPCTASSVPVDVVVLEWTDPVFACGHWVPEMVAAAGGRERLGIAGGRSVPVEPERVFGLDPAVLVVAPCGFILDAAVAAGETLIRRPGWRDLNAVRTGRVWALDANAVVTRPGPRLADGILALSAILHPGAGPAPAAVYARRIGG